MKIFLDTSAIIARYNAYDKYHDDASKVMEEIAGGAIPLTRFYISDYIFDEAMTFIECVLGNHEMALEVGEALLSSPFTTLLKVDEETFEDTWNRFKVQEGSSFTDCSSFVLMESYGISHSFTFDEHFTRAGFQTLP
ncbi:MAG: PIN domain-containing protein [Candidatus Bathyarchaeota archaeon]|nr:PIN domain-containing protein [Candidatus Bathyarchaeota archaeon]